MTTTLSPLSRPQWRLLNHLQTSTERGGPRRNVRVLMATEDATHHDLVALQDAELIDAHLDGTPVSIEDLTGRFGWDKLELSLTGKGRKTVTGTPWIRVLRTIGHNRNGRPAGRVKADAGVDDDLLKEMAARRLVEAWPNAEGALLETLRRIPDNCGLRLTDRGREYLPN